MTEELSLQSYETRGDYRDSRYECAEATAADDGLAEVQQLAGDA